MPSTASLLPRPSILGAAFAAALLAGCGGASPDGGAVEAARGLLNVQALAANLPPEARAVVTSYERDLRAAAKAHLAEYGRLPASFANLASVEGVRTSAVSLLADGLGEQLPFASRATLETAATGLVTAAEQRILQQLRASDAPNP